MLTSEKFNEGRKPTSLAIRFTEHPNEVPVAKRSSHGRLLSTLWLPNLGDELGSHTVCREYIPMYDLLAADIGRHGIPVQIKAINGGVAVHAESLSPFWGGSGAPNQTAFIITDLTERPSDLSDYRLIGRWRALLYLIRNSFFVPQAEQAFWFAGFHRFDYSL